MDLCQQIKEKLPLFVERELKLVANGDFDAQGLLAKLRAVAHLGEPQRKLMRAVYMDTRSRCMARAGLSGRWRRVAHRGSLQVKPVLLIPGLVLQRVELGRQLRRGDDPARELKQLVQSSVPARLRGLPIPEVVIRSRREVYMVHSESGCVAELSLDSSTALLPGRRKGQPFAEVELELVEGGDGFDELVELIAAHGGLAPSGKSKHQRALELLGLPLMDLTSPAPEYSAESTTDAVARAVCNAQWNNVRSHEPGTRISLDVEYLHKMRVSTRRLRAALKTFECCFTLATRNYLQTNLRWLAAVLGEVRDMDVQLLQLDRHRRTLSPEPPAGWERLREVLRGRREQAVARMRVALDSARYQRLCERVPQVFRSTPRRPWDHPGRQEVVFHAEVLVTRRVKQFARASRKCDDDPEAERVHALRIRGKKLRYTCEFFAPLYRPRYRTQVKRLAPFQDVLGLFNDSVVCGELARQLRDQALAGEGAGDGPYLYVLGLLDASSQAEAHHARTGVAAAYEKMGGGRALKLLSAEAQRAGYKQRRRMARQEQQRIEAAARVIRSRVGNSFPPG